MLKTQMKFQKIVTFAVFAMCIVMFAYSLGIMTDPYSTLYNAIDPELDFDSKGQFAPAFYFYDAQEYNSIFTTLTLILFLVSLTMFFVNMAKRRRYYIGNFVSVGLVSVCAVGFTIWAIPNIAVNREIYSAIDLVGLEEVLILKGYIFQAPSMYWFDLGYILCGLLVLSVIALVFNLIWKLKLMKAEERLLKDCVLADRQVN